MNLEVVKMKTLFISSYDELVTIALLKDGKLLSKKEEISNRSHSIILVPTIEEILKENSLETNDLNEIVVVSGPGSFTGVRLGITVAKTLAYTLNIPIKTITSIEALACSTADKDKIITIDDPKGKYIGKFINNQPEDLIYLPEEEAINYINDSGLNVYKEGVLNIENILSYLQDVKPTPAHAVKAVYIKGIEALNGK